jgi:hypothetical protein
MHATPSWHTWCTWSTGAARRNPTSRVPALYTVYRQGVSVQPGERCLQHWHACFFYLLVLACYICSEAGVRCVCSILAC